MIIESKKNKIAALTITIVLFLLFFLILWYLKIEDNNLSFNFENNAGGGDIAVNFGDSKNGFGQNTESLETAVSQQKSSNTVPQQNEALLTNETDENDVAVSQGTEPKVNSNKIIEPSKVTDKPKISKSTDDALQNILNATADGNSNRRGNQGASNGSTKSAGYQGIGGSAKGSGEGIGGGNGYGSNNGSNIGSGNYKLVGRKVLNKPNPRYDCDEQGTVVVQIKVNNAGVVIEAISGTKGTTNSAKCLAEQAKIAALSTRFDTNDSAPVKQVGQIIYNFKLSE